MPVNLSIKAVPDVIAERLRQQAKAHHRSLQGELLAILERTVNSDRYLTPSEVLQEVRLSGLETPSESAGLIRQNRDGR